MNIKMLLLMGCLAFSQLATAHKFLVTFRYADIVGNQHAFIFTKNACAIACIVQDVQMEVVIADQTDESAMVKIAAVDLDGQVVATFTRTVLWNEEVSFSFDRSDSLSVIFVFKLVKETEDEVAARVAAMAQAKVDAA